MDAARQLLSQRGMDQALAFHPRNTLERRRHHADMEMGFADFTVGPQGTGMASGVTRNLLLLAGALIVATGPPHPAIYQPTLAGLTGQATVVFGVVCLWACASTAAARWKWIVRRSLPT